MWRLVLVIFIAVVSCHDESCFGPYAALPPDGCYWNCNRKCINYLTKRNSTCSKIVCPPDKCGCIRGTYYDTNYDMCVLPEDCTYPE